MFADIATVFNYPPFDPATVDLPELMGWHARAVERRRAEIEASRGGRR